MSYLLLENGSKILLESGPGSAILLEGSSGPTTATLSGPTTSTEGLPSTAYFITLDQPAASGGVSCAITSSVGGDTITSTPIVIAQGQTQGMFTVTASTLGARTITLASTTPSLTISGSPITLTAAAPGAAGSITFIVSYPIRRIKRDPVPA